MYAYIIRVHACIHLYFKQYVVTLCGSRSREAKSRLFGPSGLRGRLHILLEHLPAMPLPLPLSTNIYGYIKHLPERLSRRFGTERPKPDPPLPRPNGRCISPRLLPSPERRRSLLLQGAGAWPPNDQARLPQLLWGNLEFLPWCHWHSP